MDAIFLRKWFGSRTQPAQVALKVVLGLVCASHLVLGILAMASPPEPISEAIIKSTYGATVTLTPQLQHVLRILGAFMVAVGVMGGFAMLNPQRNQAIIYSIALLLLLRVAQRIIFADEIESAFGIPTSRVIVQSVFFFALAAVLFFLCPRGESATSDQAIRT